MKVYIKMGGKITKFGDIEIQKQKFCQYKKPISIKGIDTNKIVHLMRSLLVKKDLNILLTSKILKNQTFIYISPKHEYI